jgi:hypothetical protein
MAQSEQEKYYALPLVLVLLLRTLYTSRRCSDCSQLGFPRFQCCLSRSPSHPATFEPGESLPRPPSQLRLTTARCSSCTPHGLAGAIGPNDTSGPLPKFLCRHDS